LHREIKNLLQKHKSGLPLTLIHSRFRLVERKERVQELLQAEGKPGIVISTQVVEAGVDISAEVLFTELAPWSSLVQRFGRCNRRGKDKNARIFWIDLDAQELASPYENDQLTRARKRLHQLAGADASPAKLETLPLTAEDNPQTVHVIRSKDFVELFDTTPDLAGNDIDIDHYVRETDDSSVHIFWREWDGKAPLSDMPSARREELCPVPMGGFNEFVKNHVAKNHGVWPEMMPSYF
jgi:CRISPR-associated endonuclease/helicase Cas3